jgi:hypothetical protein
MLIEKLLAVSQDINLIKKSTDLTKAARVELKRLNIDESLFDDAQM